MALGALNCDPETSARINRLVREPAAGWYVRPHPRQAPDDLPMLAAHERIAETITSYDPLMVPALRQTEDYARAALAHTTDVDHAVRLRMRRQRRFDLRFRPRCRMTFFIHENAVAFTEDDQVMHEQVMALAIVADIPGHQVRLVPANSSGILGHPPLRQPVTVMTFTRPIAPLSYTETTDSTVFTDAGVSTGADHATYQPLLEHLDRIALTPAETATELHRRVDPASRIPNR
ncbi:Scr1 family TA system antitoxin-like transcriptional regulator [Saccharothrix deserti]|uniref:Scr1 family TA system antitoxin-like transcriptional regulator n=1 Tax=Saccharothrix deserti TaxID=2593674 RepID=UPI00131A7F39|nr:Scr1 family TA system antitoxin-like transcriptional regulator [Saccharothrix deserti]